LPDLPDYVIQAGEQFGGLARRFVWRVRCGLVWGRYESKIAGLNLVFQL
jgi:hypothetical protein